MLSSTLIQICYCDLQTMWSPGFSLWTLGCTACTFPGLSSPDQLAAHSSSICCWSPGARLRGVRHCSNDRWFIWVNLPLWLEERRGGGDKEKDVGRNGTNDTPPHFHSQSCWLQITTKWLHLMNVISVHVGQQCGINPVQCCTVTNTVASWYSVRWNKILLPL